MTKPRSQGLVAATHTPFHKYESLHLTIVEKQAAHLQDNGVSHAFIGGTIGESSSLTLDERRALAVRWFEVTVCSALKVIVHVGFNCIADLRNLAGIKFTSSRLHGRGKGSDENARRRCRLSAFALWQS